MKMHCPITFLTLTGGDYPVCSAKCAQLMPGLDHKLPNSMIRRPAFQGPFSTNSKLQLLYLTKYRALVGVMRYPGYMLSSVAATGHQARRFGPKKSLRSSGCSVNGVLSC